MEFSICVETNDPGERRGGGRRVRRQDPIMPSPPPSTCLRTSTMIRRRKASKKTGPNHDITTTFDLVENLNNDHDQINIIIAKVTIKVFLFIFLSPDFLSHFSFFLFKHHTFSLSLSLLNMVPWFWWITQTLKYLNRPGPNG